MAIMLLEGQDEESTFLTINAQTLRSVLERLQCALDRKLDSSNTHWIVWKVMASIANMAINDNNKQLLGELCAVPVIVQVLRTPETGAAYNEFDDPIGGRSRMYAALSLYHLSFHQGVKKTLQQDEELLADLRRIAGQSVAKKMPTASASASSSSAAAAAAAAASAGGGPGAGKARRQSVLQTHENNQNEDHVQAEIQQEIQRLCTFHARYSLLIAYSTLHTHHPTAMHLPCQRCTLSARAGGRRGRRNSAGVRLGV
jgi:hypothetical protein